MSYIGIVAYSATKEKDGILLQRHWGNWQERYLCQTFDEAVEFLAADLGKCFSITWSLGSFTNALFALMPKRKLAEFETKNTVYCGRNKVFFTKHLLGITQDKVIKENIIARRECNLFQLVHWLPDGTAPPQDTAELAKMGESIIVALQMMNLYPKSLSSPVKAYVANLNSLHFPTYRSMPEEWQPALEMASTIAKREWHSVFQVGYWDETFLYDLAGAYPSLMSELRDTKMVVTEHSETLPSHYDFALLSGMVEITAPVSPLVHPSGINPKGSWEDAFTSEEIDLIERWKLGAFRMKDGYFFTFTGLTKPYQSPVSELWKFRQSPNKMVQTIARRAAQGLSGLLDEEYPERRGDFYNPIYAAMVRSRCRLRVADFIYGNGLLDGAIQVQVDSVLSSTLADVEKVDGLGSWCLKEQSPALVLGRGRVWRRSSRDFGDIVRAFRAKPRANHYEVNGHYIDLLSPTTPDRKFKEFPKNGGQALKRIYRSEPISVG